MQPLADFADPEQHHAQKTGFEKKRGHHFIGHQGADDRPGLCRKHRPVGAELVRHDQTRDDAHAKDERKDLEPVAVEIGVNAGAGLQPQAFQHHQVAGQPDRERREDEMERDGEGKLCPGQSFGVAMLEERPDHCFAPFVSQRPG